MMGGSHPVMIHKTRDFQQREEFKRNILDRISILEKNTNKPIITKCSIEFNDYDYKNAETLLDNNITDVNIIYKTISSLYNFNTVINSYY